MSSKGRTSVVHIKQDTKRISKETGQKCVNMYGYVVQDGEWTRMDSSDLDKFLFTNPQTGFCMPRGNCLFFSDLFFIQ